MQSVSQLPGQPVVSLPVPEGKKPIASFSKSSEQIVDSPATKVVKKKREVTHEVSSSTSSSSSSSHSAVLVPDPAPVPSSVPFMPMRFCSHLVRKGGCAYGDGCSFAHSSDELHSLAAQQEFDMADIVESLEGVRLIRDLVVFVVRLQVCLWWGPAPHHTSPSPMSLCASSSTSSLMLVRSRSRLLVASGSRLVSLCLSCCSGVGRAGGLASPCPFLGAVYVEGLLATVRGFQGSRGQGLGIPWPLLRCQGRVSCASRRSDLGGLFFPLCYLNVFCFCVLARNLTLFLILWAVDVVWSEVLSGMLGASCFGSHGARFSVSHVSWCSLVEAPCSIPLFQFMLSYTCEDFFVFFGVVPWRSTCRPVPGCWCWCSPGCRLFWRVFAALRGLAASRIIRCISAHHPAHTIFEKIITVTNRK